MASLAARFREVEVTFDGPPPAPTKKPESWMHVNSGGTVVRFIESRFDEQRTNAEIRETFGNVRDTTFTPMTLRSIFLAMARSQRTAA